VKDDGLETPRDLQISLAALPGISVLKAGVNTTSIDQVIEPVVGSLLEFLSTFLGSKNISVGPYDADVLGGILASASVEGEIFNMNLSTSTLGDDLITVEPGLDEGTVTLRVQTGELQASLDIELNFEWSFLGIGGGCDVGAGVTLTLGDASIDYDVTIPPSTTTVKLVPRDLDIFDISLKLTPDPDYENLCSDVLETFDNLIDGIQGLFNGLVGDRLKEFLDEFLVDYLPSTNFTADVPSLPILGIGEISFSPNIPSFFENGGEVVAGLNLDTEAEITGISWRNGEKLQNSSISGKDIPDPLSENIATVYIGEDGLNDVVEKLWYIAWAGLTNAKEDARNSTLCDDPCILPPYSETIRRRNLFRYVPLSLFIGGFGGTIKIEAVFDPPKLIFEDDVPLRAEANVTVNILRENAWFGRDKNEILNASAGVSVSDLVYENGTFSGLQILDPALSLSSSNRFHDFIFNIIEDRFLSLINNTLASLNIATAAVFSHIPGIPPIKNFPTAGKELRTDLLIALEGHSGGLDTQSYVGFVGNLDLKIVEDNSTKVNFPVREARDSSRGTTIFNKCKERLESSPYNGMCTHYATSNGKVVTRESYP